jgi:hypothetical protein
MRSIVERNDVVERPRGVVLLAWVLFALAALMIVYGALIATSVIAFTQASWLIGMEAAQLGPAVFVVGAALYVVCGVGMLRLWKWARWLAILLIVAGLAQQVPTVSAAVAEFHFVLLLREGILFIGRVVCLRYLFQPDVRELFESR